MLETQVWSLGLEDPLEKEMAIHSSILPAESHRQRSLAGYSPCSYKELNRTEWLHLVVWDKREYVLHDESLNVTFEKKIFMFLIIRWMFVFFSWESVQGPSPFCLYLNLVAAFYAGSCTSCTSCAVILAWGNIVFLSSSLQFSSVQSLSRVWLFVTPWIVAHQASLTITNSWSLPKPMSIKSVMPSSHLILCRPLLLLPPIPPSIRVFSNESTLPIRWPKY